MKSSQFPRIGIWALLLSTVGFAPMAAFAQNCNQNGWCHKGDMDLNRQTQVVDIPAFVTAILTDTTSQPAKCLADCNNDNLLNGQDVLAFVRIVLSGDTDGDLLPNLWETNNGTFSGPTTLGTNPMAADTDGDAINDYDEVFCTAAPGGGGLNLRALGGSPVKKNIFVEIDWFNDNSEGGAHSHAPTAASVATVVTTFANSPVPNPFGGAPNNGIVMIVDYGQGAPLTGGNMIGGGDTVVGFDGEFNTYKAANFAANRNNYFHYVISCHRYSFDPAPSTNNPSSGIAELPGDDLIVSLFTFHTNYNFSTTLMHELGHNLNLQHGGNEGRNFKPNYNSIMNYRYQFPGIDGTCGVGAGGDACGDAIINYSTGGRINLNEGALNENHGVCGAAGPAINWNGVGGITTPVMQNINCICGTTAACGTGMAACPAADGGDSVCNAYTDFNDWANVSFTGINEADFAGGERQERRIITCQDIPEPYRINWDDNTQQFNWIVPLPAQE